MNAKSALHRIARFLLKVSLRLAPPGTQDWGTAMLAEIDQIDSPWQAIAWSLGAMGVVAQQTIVAFFTGGSEFSLSELQIFRQEGSVPKAMSIVRICCIAGVATFLFFPVFRQGLEISIIPWVKMFQWGPESHEGQSQLRKIAEQAKRRHDAEAMAFVAVRLNSGKEAADLAQEAVALNPDLTWVLFVVASDHPLIPMADDWARRLEAWDPQNATPYLITAEEIDIASVLQGHYSVMNPPSFPGEKWNDALAAAFRSLRFDTYLSRQIVVDRRVAQRYRLTDPMMMMRGLASLHLPSYASWDINRYAGHQIDAAKEMASNGNEKSAAERYWAVAQFGQVIRSQSQSKFERWIGTQVQAKAYEALQISSAKAGNQALAAFFASHATESKQEVHDYFAFEPYFTPGSSIYNWNSSLMAVFGILTLAFGIVTLASLCIKNRVNALISGSAAATGLLLSAVMVSVCYWPYAGAFNQFIQSGKMQAHDLFILCSALGEPPFGVHKVGQQSLAYFAWSTVTVLLTLMLTAVVVRMLVKRRRTQVPAHA